MNILITTGVYPPEIGGPATYTKMIESHLPKYGHKVSVLPFSTVRHLPKIVRHISYFMKCFSRARHADILFAQDPVSVGLPTMVVARLLRKKFFLRLGGDYAWEQGRLRFGVTTPLEEFACTAGHHHGMVRIFIWVQKTVASAAHKVAVQSDFMKRIVTCWGIECGKIYVIPNGFDADVTTLNKQSARKEFGREGTIAVSAGRLVPWKGIGELIKIVPEILKRIPDFILFVIGEGPEEQTLRALVDEKGLQEKVLFTGRLDKEVLTRYLVAADIFVLNTEYEGFSNQLLEVFAAGTPIVTTAVGGNLEMITHNQSGFLIAPHDEAALKNAILEVLTDCALSKRLVDGGREKLKEFSVERVVKATNKFLSGSV